MNDTPRTAAQIVKLTVELTGFAEYPDTRFVVPADVARELERENTALRAERDTLADIAAQAQRDLVEQTKSLRADKARLDWLEKSCTGASNSERYLPFHVYWGKVKTIRAAIDAALAGKEGPA